MVFMFVRKWLCDSGVCYSNVGDYLSHLLEIQSIACVDLENTCCTSGVPPGGKHWPMVVQRISTCHHFHECIMWWHTW